MTRDETVINGLLVGGREIAGAARPLTPTNPATGQATDTYQAADAHDAARICDEAARVNADGTWRATLPHQRARVLRAIGAEILRQKTALAETQMTQNGKTYAECLGQAEKAAEVFSYYASVVETVEGEVTPPRGDYFSFTEYEPYGVILSITPWNSPLTLDAQKIAPALAAGNVIVHKPSEVTPGVGLMLGRIALEAGLPAGVLNVINGRGPELGDALLTHPAIRMISFTGGTATGRYIAQVAAKRLVPVSLELGGKSPHIVFADADLEAAAASVASGIFGSMGQSCVAGSRLLVDASVHRDFVDMVADHAKKYVPGDPRASTTQLGPMATFDQRDIVERFVKDAVGHGARLVVGGERGNVDGFPDGAFFLPTVLDGVTIEDRVAQEEVFGPVLAVTQFDGWDDLIAKANGTAFGLAAGIWTRDFPLAYRTARQLEAGTVWINSYKTLSISTPFGGAKDSGLGREKGIQGMRLYQQTKGLYVAL